MVGAVVLFVSMSVQSAAPSSDDVIKIGIVASQTGPLIPWGTDCIRGAQLAVDQFNDAGGIYGKKVLLLVADSASTPEGGKSAAEKLVREGVVGLLGDLASGITQPMARVSSEHGVPHVIVGATKSDLTEIGDNVFRVCYTDDFQGPVMAKFAYDTLGLRKVALMTDNRQPYSYYLSQSFKQFFEGLGGEIVAEESYESGQSNFLYELVKVKGGDPEGIFLSGYFNEVGPIAMQASQMGMEDVKLLGGDGWESMELLASGDAIVGGFFCSHYSNDEQRPEVQNFVTAWRARHGSPPGTTMGALGYDAAALLMDAIMRARSTDSEAVIEALGNTVGFKGVTGTITLKGMGGDAARPALVLRVTRDGFVHAKTMSYEEVYGGGAGSGVLRKNTK